MNKFLKSISLERGRNERSSYEPLMADKFSTTFDSEYVPLKNETQYYFKVNFNHHVWIRDNCEKNLQLEAEIIRKCNQVLHHYIFGDTQALLRELWFNLDLKDYDACIEILKLAMKTMDYE